MDKNTYAKVYNAIMLATEFDNFFKEYDFYGWQDAHYNNNMIAKNAALLLSGPEEAEQIENYLWEIVREEHENDDEEAQKFAKEAEALAQQVHYYI